MANPLFRVHGTGCGLADLIHPTADFSSPLYAPYRSPSSGDGGAGVPGGGIEMGKVVFLDDLAAAGGMGREKVLADLNAPAGAAPVFSAGGPGLASLVL